MQAKRVLSTLIAASLALGSTPLALADYQDGESTVYYDASIKAPSIGNYEFEVETHEVPSHEWLPIVSKDYFPSTTAQFITEVDNLPPSATYEAKALTKVDVVFAFGEMSQSQQMQDYMSSFEQRLGSAGNNIDAYIQKVETSTLDMNSMSANTIMSTWINYPGAHLGSNYEAGWKVMGTALGATTNVNWTGFWNKEYCDVTDVMFEFDAVIGNHQDPQGWTFRMNESNGVYSFYAVELNHNFNRVNLARIDSWKPGSYATHGGPLYHGMINGQDGTYHGGTGQAGSYQGAVGELLNSKPSSLVRSGLVHVQIEAKGNNIKVYIGGSTTPLIDYTDNSSKALKNGSFGPYTCSQYTSSFDNIYVEMGASKSLGEAISDVAWRDNSVRFVIYGEDTIPDYMRSTSNADYQYTVTKLLNSNAYLIPLGTSKNKSTLEGLIKYISTPQDTKGKFFYNSPILTAMNSACDWIISLVRNKAKPTQWILINTPVTWNTIYKDSEHDLPLNFGEHDGQGTSLSDKADTSDITLASSWGKGLTYYFKNQDKILAEKWRYTHNYTFYDNATHEETFSKVWLSDPVEIFPEPGLYRINYKRKDNPFYPDVNLSNPFDEYRYWSTDYDPVVVDNG